MKHTSPPRVARRTQRLGGFVRALAESYEAQRSLFRFGGVLSFELKGGMNVAEEFPRKLKIVQNAPSLGGVQTLLMRPAVTSHAGMTSQARERLGISDELIRLSVGLEATEDLVADLNQALSN